MRRSIIHPGADALVYEIRQIVAIAQKLQSLGVSITWENIGDPIHKGEKVAPWIRDIVQKIIQKDESWGYTASQGAYKTREFLAAKVNERGGATITPDDIIFFNGLGDAVAKIFGFMRREARILGPSPAYSTFSSAEAAHSGYEHLTYELNPDKSWMPDLEDIENKVKYNDSITGVLLINPDNPTGAVYPQEVIKEIVSICEKYDCILICDETYAHVNYSGESSLHLSECIGDNVPAMALRSISKELPWPGGRCGWIEVLNREKDQVFSRYVKSLIDAKTLEVCSTTLPQMAIPEIYSSPNFVPHLQQRNQKFKQRAKQALELLKGTTGIKVVEPKGGFFLTIQFEDSALASGMYLQVSNLQAKKFLEPLLQGVRNDRRFILYLLAAKGICAVPLTSFNYDKDGFRITLLEEDPEKFVWIMQTVRESIEEYLQSCR
ncbi:MAG: pyridoxal phosphate-dependent aminotransferase [Spirochaetota bacterium]